MSKNNTNLNDLLNQAIQQDGGLTVFEHYGFTPQRQAQKINPFRQERTSSFFVIQKFDKIIYKDFGDDTYKGDCKKFVQQIENIEYKEAFKILCSIYNLGDFSLPDPKIFQPLPSQTKKKKSFEKKLLEIQFKDFTTEELAFWEQKGKIDKITLEKNRVKSIRSFKLEMAEGKIKEFINLSFVFAYEIVENKAYKLYMPKSPYRVYTKGKTAFLPNLNAARQTFGEEYSYSFGIDTLQKDTPSILCAGEADCLALKAAGYNAFTLGDERSGIPAYAIQKLAQKNISIQSVSVLYDTDFTGLKASKKLAKSYQLQQLILPKLPQQTHKNAPKPKENDICDYVGIYGWDHDLKLLLSKHIFQNQDYKLSYVPCLSVEKYLSEQTEVATRFIRQHKRVQIDADAGVGKTYTLLAEIAEKLQKPMLFVVPFAIQVEQIEREYGEKIPDLMCFSNQKLQQMDEEELAVLGTPVGKINVCTFDRIKIIYEKLNQEYALPGDQQAEIVVVVDESHLLTSEYGYRTQAIHQVLEVCNEAFKVVYLSATPDYSLCKFSGFKLIRFKRQKNPTIDIHAFDYAGEPKKNLLKLLLENSPATPGKTTVVRVNNKTLGKVIANLLIERGIYQKDEIDYVFSEKRKGVTTLSKESIIHQSCIPAPVRLLFVTSCFDCGINIQNINIDKIISFETRYTDNCKDTFKQFIARFRNLEQVQVWVCKPKKYLDLPPLRTKTKLYKRLENDAQNKLALLPYNDPFFFQKVDAHIADIEKFGLNTPKTPRYIKSNQDISAIHKLLQKNKETNHYTINYNYIRFTIKEYERKGINSNNFYTDIIKELPNANLCTRDTLQPTTGKDLEKFKELLQKEKELKKERIQQIGEIMHLQTQGFFDAVHQEYKDVALKRHIKKHFAVSSQEKSPSLDNIIKSNIRTKKEKLQSIEAFDEEIITLSHRYFFLKELLVPASKIPTLLTEYANEVKFGKLTKTLINQINLLVRRKTGEKTHLLMTDYRKLEDTQWLELLIDEVKNLRPKTYQQKKTPQLKAKWQSLEYDLKMLQYQQRNLWGIYIDYLLRIQQGEKLKSKLRSIKRKLRTLAHKINRLGNKIQTAREKYEHSIIQGFEINELSDKMNKLRPHTSDWQGVTANIRLLSSLFHLKNHKRAILTYDETGTPQFTEKYIFEVGEELSFKECLQLLGFQKEEAQNYLEYLEYQIAMDLQQHQSILSGKTQKSTKPTIHDKHACHDSIEKVKIFDYIENVHGYPKNWD